MAPSRISVPVDFTSYLNIVDGIPRSAKTFHQGVNPATKSKLWEVPIATHQDVDDAVAAANEAFKAWSETPFDERRELIQHYGDALKEYEKEFTDLIQKECGKPEFYANWELKYLDQIVSYHVQLVLPEVKANGEGCEIITRYVPLGVVGAICPWNYPMILSFGKIVPALLTGNVVIVKPSPYTPYSALKLVEIAQDIFPPGVMQVLGGDDNLGPWMTAHPGIHKIAFTGSIATGKKIMEACAKSLKRVTLELGGNDASIVCDDVDIKKTAPEVAMGAFQNSGQVCVATKRIYIHESIYREFVDEMTLAARLLKVGAPGEKGVILGPIQNEMQYEKVKCFFNDSKQAGYKFTTGGEVQATDGYFVEPAIVDNPPNDSMIIREEPFGPIVPVQPWNDENEVLRRANDSNTGLGACVWSKDLVRARRIAEQLEAGSVFVNSWEKLTPKAFFGGHKESGFGGEWGEAGLLGYCSAQSIHYYD